MSIRSTGKTILYVLRRAFVPWRRSSRAVVLLYHSIRDDARDPYAITPEAFVTQLEQLRKDGFTVVTIAALEEMLRSGTVAPRTAVLTFDDGRADNYTEAFPILSRFGMPATIFSATDAIDGRFETSSGSTPALTSRQMQEMQASGLIDFEPHSASHRKLTELDTGEVEREVAESKSLLESLLGKPCPYFAYPKGRVNPEVARIASHAGVRLAFGTSGGLVRAGSDLLVLPRNDIRASVSPAQFRGILAHGAL